MPISVLCVSVFRRRTDLSAPPLLGDQDRVKRLSQLREDVPRATQVLRKIISDSILYEFPRGVSEDDSEDEGDLGKSTDSVISSSSDKPSTDSPRLNGTLSTEEEALASPRATCYEDQLQ